MSEQSTGVPRVQEHSQSESDSNSIVEQMKLYVEQVVTICMTMMTFLQQLETTTKDGQSEGSAAAMETSNSRQNDQVAFLKQKLKELVDMNVGWQQTHQQQELRIRELQEVNEQLKEEIERLSQQLLSTSAAGLSEQQQADIDRQFLEQQHKYDILEEEKNRIEDKYMRLSRESGDVQALKERVQHLEMQLVTHREDFLVERQDRERAQSKIAELEQEIQRYRSRGYSSLLQSQYEVLPSCTNQVRIENQRSYRHAPGRYMTDSHDGPDNPVDIVEDGPNPTFTSGNAMQRLDDLQCPNCDKRFSRDHHEQFMDHLDRCTTE